MIRSSNTTPAAVPTAHRNLVPPASIAIVERMSGPFIAGAPIPLNTVEQTEIGTKFRWAGFESFLTLFSARTAEENYDVTTHLLTADHYTAQGAELEAGYHLGGFDVRGGLTYTNAKIIGSNITADLGDHTLVSLSANNVFNRIGWTEYDNGQGARSINGRMLKATVQYNF